MNSSKTIAVYVLVAYAIQMDVYNQVNKSNGQILERQSIALSIIINGDVTQTHERTLCLV